MPGSRYSTAKFLTAVACVRAAANIYTKNDRIDPWVKLRAGVGCTRITRPPANSGWVDSRESRFGMTSCEGPTPERRTCLRADSGHAPARLARNARQGAGSLHPVACTVVFARLCARTLEQTHARPERNSRQGANSLQPAECTVLFARVCAQILGHTHARRSARCSRRSGRRAARWRGDPCARLCGRTSVPLRSRWMRSCSYLLGLLAMIKCSICSYQSDI